MAVVDRAAPVTFLRVAYEASDWVAVFLKTFRTGGTAQRVVPATVATSGPFQAWLRHMNATSWNVYVSVNAVSPGRSRRRDAISAVRHVFLEEDRDGPKLLARVTGRRDLPTVSYVLHSSPGRVHVFWRVRGFTPDGVEGLQRRLARQLGTDPAATSCAQTTRLPGFMNHKRERPHLVSVDYGDTAAVFAPSDFPPPDPHSSRISRTNPRSRPAASFRDSFEQARRFIARVPPAIAGQHGDLRTFRICCRLVRGFALSHGEALALLRDWNDRCEPPWSEQELLEKIDNANRYGREPLGHVVRRDEFGTRDA